MAKLEAGATAPAFTLPDQDGKPVKLSDFKGQRVIVYFYPADDTPGCTKEACQFNDNLKTFEKAGVAVLGISPDKAEKHVKFRTKYKLKFPLLTDADKKVMEKYGAWGEKTMYGKKTVGTIRSTFLVGPNGKVQRAWYHVRADGHAAKVLRRSPRTEAPRARLSSARRPGRGGHMGQGISAVLTFAIGVAISPVPIIAVILMLFSQRARVNGPAFLVGWVVALAAVSTVVYVVSHDGNVATSSTASDSVSWGKIVLGVGCSHWRGAIGASVRRRARRPAMPKWLATVESVSPVKAFGLGVVLAAVNPKNLILTLGAAAGLAQVPGLSTTDAVVAIAVFVVIASLTIAGPVLYALFGGEKAQGLPRLGQGVAHRAQRGGDGRALPRLRRRPHRQGAAAARRS